MWPTLHWYPQASFKDDFTILWGQIIKNWWIKPFLWVSITSISLNFKSLIKLNCFFRPNKQAKMEIGRKRHHFVSFPSEAAQLNINPVSSAITEVWADPDSPTTSIFHTRMQHWSDLNLTQVRIFIMHFCISRVILGFFLQFIIVRSRDIVESVMLVLRKNISFSLRLNWLMVVLCTNHNHLYLSYTVLLLEIRYLLFTILNLD